MTSAALTTLLDLEVPVHSIQGNAEVAVLAEMSGTQAAHTDFVFTVTGEEVSWSFVGPVLVLLVLVGAVADSLRRRKAGKKR